MFFELSSKFARALVVTGVTCFLVLSVGLVVRFGRIDKPALFVSYRFEGGHLVFTTCLTAYLLEPVEVPIVVVPDYLCCSIVVAFFECGRTSVNRVQKVLPELIVDRFEVAIVLYLVRVDVWG
ncbi:hypothetical protein [Halalkalicoccus salilacus]|uniref:hypothetical protein n=1 Tax=Halalkalicoccus TaxID=332246 RepID=UPI002F965226